MAQKPKNLRPDSGVSFGYGMGRVKSGLVGETPEAPAGRCPTPRQQAGPRRDSNWCQTPSRAAATGRTRREGVRYRKSRLGRLFGELVVAEGAGARHERRLEALLDRLLRDHALGDVLARGQLEHHVEQRVLDDRPQAARARLAVE